MGSALDEPESRLDESGSIRIDQDRPGSVRMELDWLGSGRKGIGWVQLR